MLTAAPQRLSFFITTLTLHLGQTLEAAQLTVIDRQNKEVKTKCITYGGYVHMFCLFFHSSIRIGMLFCRVIIWQRHFLAGSVFGCVPAFCHQVIHRRVCVCVCVCEREHLEQLLGHICLPSNTHRHTLNDKPVS